MQIDPLVHDTGVVPQGRIFEADFTFTNHFRKPLIIEHTRASCSCTTPKTDKDTLQPGESTAVRTTWSTKNIRGEHATEVTVTYKLEGGQSHDVQLKIVAVVQAKLECESTPIRIDPKQIEPVVVRFRPICDAKFPDGLLQSVTTSHRAFRVEKLTLDSFEIHVDPLLIDDVGSFPVANVSTRDSNDPYLRIPIVVGKWSSPSPPVRSIP